jgi:mannosyltransferase OCH1-like enzyme
MDPTIKKDTPEEEAPSCIHPSDILEEYYKKCLPFEMKESYNSVIPLKHYTCWHTKDLPPLMKENYEKLVKANPELEHYLYDEKDCHEFIKENFDYDVALAYDALIPCSYKSDLWRFCVLYINGGIYLDIKYKCDNGFRLVALTEKEYFVRDREQWGGTYTALISCKPGNEVMFRCIYDIVKNVKTRNYGKTELYPTGPGLLGLQFTKEEKAAMELYFENVNLGDTIDLYHIVYKNIAILSYYDNYRNEQKKYQKKKYYADLWWDKNIYKTGVFKTKFIQKSSYNSIIPLKVYTCWHDKNFSIKMKENLKLLEIENPEFEICVYDNDECKEFILKHFGKLYVDAYEALIPHSYKSDFWRFCVLFINGGIYMDIKFKCVNGFKLIMLTEKEHFPQDVEIPEFYGVHYKGGRSTGMISAKPGNAIFLNAVNKILDNIKENYFGTCPLDPTGPGLLGTFFSQEEKNNTIVKRALNDQYNGYAINNIFILAAYKGYWNEQKKHYNKYWVERNIYKIS